MAFFSPKHSSAATARLTEDPDVVQVPRRLPPRHPTSPPSKPHRGSRAMIATEEPKSPGIHRRVASQDWDEDHAAATAGSMEPAKVAPSLLTKSTSFSSTDSDDDDDDDDDDYDDDSDYSDVDDCDLSGCSSGSFAGWGSLPELHGGDNDDDGGRPDEVRSVTSHTSATTGCSSTRSLTDAMGKYDSDGGDGYDAGDMRTLDRLVNKLHARELAKDAVGRRTPKINNHRKTSSSTPSPLMTPVDLPSEQPEDPPHFSPLQSSHRLSISSVESWRGPSLEVVPTEDVADILPLWRSQWKTDRREWEQRREEEADLTAFGRSRTHNGARAGPGASIALRRRNNSAPSKIRRHNRVRHPTRMVDKRKARRSTSASGAQSPSSPSARSSTSSTRHYRYGKPPTLPNAKNPNPMVSKSSKKINRKHARYALAAGMMLGIRESVGGAMGVENEIEISSWESWERGWMEGEEDEAAEEGADVPVSWDAREAEVDGDGSAAVGASSSDRLSYKTLTQECQRVSKYKFPPHQFYLGSNTSRPLPHKYKFKVYAPLVFARIRSLFGVEKQTFLHSICGKFNFYEFASNARSGQFFFYSHDGRYMIKTLTHTESKFLREILPYYYRHLTRCPSTFLTHFYGMYRVCMPNTNNQHLHFIIMRSVFHTEKKIDRVWDLKGSKTGRKASEGDGVGKDLDILEEGRKLRFVNPEARGEFLSQLTRDATFLARMGIMDYSLLLGLHNCEEEEEGGGSDSGVKGVVGPETPATPRENAGREEPSRSNTPFRRGVLMRASSAGDTDVGNNGFKALEACGNNKRSSSSSNMANAEKTTSNPELRRSASAGSASSSSALDAIIESPSTSSGSDPTSQRTSAIESSSTLANAITARSDMGIEGFSSKLEDGTLAKREIYFCGVIDILQYYNARKMGETVMRKAAGNSGQDISCVDPETYGKRFVKFLSNLVEE